VSKKLAFPSEARISKLTMKKNEEILQELKTIGSSNNENSTQQKILDAELNS
jgi:hypothetical protein